MKILEFLGNIVRHSRQEESAYYLLLFWYDVYAHIIHAQINLKLNLHIYSKLMRLAYH